MARAMHHFARDSYSVKPPAMYQRDPHDMIHRRMRIVPMVNRSIRPGFLILQALIGLEKYDTTYRMSQPDR